jgi:folate-binding protein YgfZ
VVALPGSDGIAAFGLPGRPGSALAIEGGVVFADPRLGALGARALISSAAAKAVLDAKGLEQADLASYNALRLGLGVPEGSEDLAVDKATLLESGFEELNGVDFKKGCFVGQELTARMKYRGLVKKRLMPITFEGAPPAPGSLVKAGEREIGEIRSADNGAGLALLRLDRLADVTDQGERLMADGTAVTPSKPDWVNF